LRDDGGITVHSRGYDAKSRSWKEIEGRAYFVEGPNKGRLKVAFFRPFYGA
jgi:apolipoprotein D and lipocalin family protein